MYYSTSYESPVGVLTIACDDKNLTGLWMKGQKYYGGNGVLNNALIFGVSPDAGALSKAEETQFEKPYCKSDEAHVLAAKKILDGAKTWLNRYFNGEKPIVSELPLNPAGSRFRKDVWSVLCNIPYGEVITYGEIAKIIAAKMDRKSMSSQAVGGAVGHNPISIIIPCHRVIGSNGSLTGYAGGVDIKKKLLLHEGANI